jgi:hypothetical protein
MGKSARFYKGWDKKKNGDSDLNEGHCPHLF